MQRLNEKWIEKKVRKYLTHAGLLYIYRISLFRDIRQANVWRTRDKVIEQNEKRKTRKEMDKKSIFLLENNMISTSETVKKKCFVQMHVM